MNTCMCLMHPNTFSGWGWFVWSPMPCGARGRAFGAPALVRGARLKAQQ